MSDLFDDEDDLNDETFNTVDQVALAPDERGVLDARRRLEQVLEEKRLRDELEDFIDY